MRCIVDTALGGTRETIRNKQNAYCPKNLIIIFCYSRGQFMYTKETSVLSENCYLKQTHFSDKKMKSFFEALNLISVKDAFFDQQRIYTAWPDWLNQIQLISNKRNLDCTLIQETIYLSLCAQVAVGTFFMKSPVC